MFGWLVQESFIKLFPVLEELQQEIMQMPKLV